MPNKKKVYTSKKKKRPKELNRHSPYGQWACEKMLNIAAH